LNELIGAGDDKNNKKITEYFAEIKEHLVKVAIPELNANMQELQYMKHKIKLDQALKKMETSVALAENLGRERVDLQNQHQQLTETAISKQTECTNLATQLTSADGELATSSEKIAVRLQQISTYEMQQNTLNSIINFLESNKVFVENLATATTNPILNFEPFIQHFHKLKVLNTDYVALQIIKDNRFELIIQGSSTVESPLKVALTMSITHLTNFVATYYKESIQKYTSPGADLDPFFTVMSAAIETALLAKDETTLIALCNYLNASITLLEHNKKCIDSDANLETWLNGFIKEELNLPKILESLIEPTTTLVENELDVFVAKKIGYTETCPMAKIPFDSEQDRCQNIVALSGILKKIKDDLEVIRQIPYKTKFLPLLEERNNRVEKQFNILQVQIKEAILNARLKSTDKTFQARIAELQEQYQKISKDINLIKDIFPADIDTFKTKAEDDYNFAVDTLFTDIQRQFQANPVVISEVRAGYKKNTRTIQKQQEILSLLPALSTLSRNTFLDKVDVEAKKFQGECIAEITKNNIARNETLNDFASHRITIREGMVDNFVSLIQDYQQRNKPIYGHASINNFNKDLIIHLKDFKKTGDSQSVQKHIDKNTNKVSEMELQSLINRIFVEIEDYDNLPKDKNVVNPRIIIAPLNNNAVTIKINALYHELAAMGSYGRTSFQGQNKVTIDLARALTRRLNVFVNQNDSEIQKGTLDMIKLQAFQKIFSRHLHTEDVEMNRNRGCFAFFKTETTRAGHLRQVENALYDLVTEEPTKSCSFWS
jgi:hypothetical protein